METRIITSAASVPQHLQRSAKVALAVGAEVMVSVDGEQLLAKFKDSDRYYFDPENVTLHMLEALGEARTYGFVMAATMPPDATPEFGPQVTWVRVPLVIRTVFSASDVRVQIGASKWFMSVNKSTAHALRTAIVEAFAAYYDEVIAPHTAV